jgi:hypothetical protein
VLQELGEAFMAERDSKQQELRDKLAIAYDVIEHRLTALWNAIDAIDTKTNIILGFSSAVLVLLAGFYSWGDREWPLVSLVLFGFALAAYIAVVILSTRAYKVKEWSYRPEPSTLTDHCQDVNLSVSDVRLWVTNECKLAIDKNLANLKKKATLTNYALRVFAVETTLIAVGLVYGLF